MSTLKNTFLIVYDVVKNSIGLCNGLTGLIYLMQIFQLFLSVSMQGVKFSDHRVIPLVCSDIVLCITDIHCFIVLLFFEGNMIYLPDTTSLAHLFLLLCKVNNSTTFYKTYQLKICIRAHTLRNGNGF